MRIVQSLALLSLAATAHAAEPMIVLSAADHEGEVIAEDGAVGAERVTDPDDPDRVAYRLDYRIQPGDERAYWDFEVDTDLSRFGRFEVDLALEDVDGLARWTVYFHSPPGWMGQSLPALGPPDDGLWRTHEWSRVEMTPEEMGPWTDVTAVRLSLWAAGPAEGSAYVREIRAYSDPVAVILPTWMTREDHPEAGTARALAERTVDRLREAGLRTREVADTDISQGALDGAEVAIGAYVPEIDPEAREALTEYVSDGGALLLFYMAPMWAVELVGVGESEYVRPDDGELDRIVLTEEAPEGAPEAVIQESWNAHIPGSLRPDARVIGRWVGREGVPGPAAAVLSDTGAFFSHVLTPVDSRAKARLLLSLVGHFMPGAWSMAYDTARAQVLEVGPYTTLDGLADAVAASGTDDAMAALLEGREQLTSADRSAEVGDFIAAYEEIEAARSPLVEAYGHSVPAREDEFRAVWCHSAFGVSGMTWEEAIAHLADCGFNAILPNMLWGGMAYYPSDVLPEYEDLDERGDQIEQCLEAARKHGVEVHVWKVNWNLMRTTDEWLETARAEGRLQVDYEGEQIPWLCPSSDVNADIEVESMLELVRNYDVDGIHFDYIRYPGTQGCYCPRCQEKFEGWVGHEVDDWPAAVYGPDAPLRPDYFDFRRAQINRVVEAVAEGVNEIRPDADVSAAVFGYWESSRDTVGQDWVYWVEEGWLDFVCPMDYLTNHEQFAALVEDQAEWVDGRVPMYPGIGAHSLRPDEVLHQVTLAREHAPGFTIFNYGTSLARDHLPLLAKGATASGGGAE